MVSFRQTTESTQRIQFNSALVIYKSVTSKPQPNHMLKNRRRRPRLNMVLLFYVQFSSFTQNERTTIAFCCLQYCCCCCCSVHSFLLFIFRVYARMWFIRICFRSRISFIMLRIKLRLKIWYIYYFGRWQKIHTFSRQTVVHSRAFESSYVLRRF